MPKYRLTMSLVGVLGAALGGACGPRQDMPSGSGGSAAVGGTSGMGGAAGMGGPIPSVTYYKDIAPLVTRRCAGCHNDGGLAPFLLTTYAAAKTHASDMVAVTSSGYMPPWPPAAGCGEFRDVRRLDPSEKQVLSSWIDMNMPEGDPRDLPAVIPRVGLGAPSVTLDPGVDYQPDVTLTDDYHCFLVDPGIAIQQDLIGFDVHPGTPGQVHHVLLFSVSPDQQASAEALDAAQAGIGWTCFGGSGVDGTPTIGGWVPGSGASVFPPPTGIRLPAKTRVIMQIHYNLVPGSATPDRTKADLFFAAAPVAKPAAIAAVVNTSFLIPAGARQTVSADLPINRSWALWGVVPHMHLRGAQITVGINHADGSKTCAVNIPAWDFHWQQFYYYQQPILVLAGDTIHLECTFDNQKGTTPLRWGEKTTDEMCLNYLYFSAP